ncbi:MAG: hypothetical protein HC929_16210 [Leptolyngbyaceae cyanobacterium SM2_5_2]|nr:hypothetical protein [Leptolyngbyaceae cyanobacterium SM2_5_2]
MITPNVPVKVTPGQPRPVITPSSPNLNNPNDDENPNLAIVPNIATQTAPKDPKLACRYDSRNIAGKCDSIQDRCDSIQTLLDDNLTPTYEA